MIQEKEISAINNPASGKTNKKELFIEKTLFIIAVTGLEFFLMLTLTDLKWIAEPYWVLVIAAPFAIAGYFYRKRRKKRMNQ